MKKRKGSVILIGMVVLFFSFPLVVLYVLNNGNPILKFIANTNIPVYLEEKGIKDDELMASHYVEPKHLINKDFYHGHYMVHFKDEPEVIYYYGVLKKGMKVRQFCERDLVPATEQSIDYYDKKTPSKHLETNCVNSLDNR